MTTNEGHPPRPIPTPPARLRLTVAGPEAAILWRLATRDLRSLEGEALHLLREAIRREDFATPAGEEAPR